MKRKWYVYTHKNPNTGKVFYVGKGTGNRCKSKSGRNSAWISYVNALEVSGLTYGVEITSTHNNELEALTHESALINKLLHSGEAILNRQVTEDNSKQEYQNYNQYSPLSLFVKQKRKEAGLTQVELSKKAGVGLRFIRELEAGKPTLKMDKVNNVLWLFGHTLGPTKNIYS